MGICVDDFSSRRFLLRVQVVGLRGLNLGPQPECLNLQAECSGFSDIRMVESEIGIGDGEGARG